MTILIRTILAGALLTQTSPALAQPQDKPAYGGTLTSIVHPEPPILSPLLNTATPIVLVATKINDGRVDGTLIPKLAESWEFSKDGLTLAFKLRKGVTWHDGKPFTSADVKFSIEEGLLKYSSTGKRIFKTLAKVEAPDEHSVVLTLSQPTPVTDAHCKRFSAAEKGMTRFQARGSVRENRRVRLQAGCATS